MIDEARDHGFSLRCYTTTHKGVVSYCVEINPDPLMPDAGVMVVKNERCIDNALETAFLLAVGNNKTRRVALDRVTCDRCNKGRQTKATPKGLQQIVCPSCSGVGHRDVWRVSSL